MIQLHKNQYKTAEHANSCLYLVRQKLRAHLIKVLRCTLIIIRTSKILPITVKPIPNNFFPNPNKLFYQVSKIVVFTFRDILQHLRLENINSHAYRIIISWFFNVSGDTGIPIPLDHTKINFHPAMMSRNCCNGILILMKLDEFSKRESRQNITVHNKKSFVQIWNKRNRACSPKWRIFIIIGNIEAQA